jgi:hypothetical protein
MTTIDEIPTGSTGSAPVNTPAGGFSSNGSAWRGDGGALLRALTERVERG